MPDVHERAREDPELRALRPWHGRWVANLRSLVAEPRRRVAMGLCASALVTLGGYWLVVRSGGRSLEANEQTTDSRATFGLHTPKVTCTKNASCG